MHEVKLDPGPIKERRNVPANWGLFVELSTGHLIPLLLIPDDRKYVPPAVKNELATSSGGGDPLSVSLPGDPKDALIAPGGLPPSIETLEKAQKVLQESNQEIAPEKYLPPPGVSAGNPVDLPPPGVPRLPPPPGVPATKGGDD